jgi:DivIVA domain-containing protein
MDVSAQTLREVEFREKLRGYHPDDVDEFLERVAAGIEYLQDRLRQATERAQRAEAKATDSNDSEDALKRTLVLAQRTAEMAVKEARQEAERIAAGARAEANAIVAQAEDMARRTIEETQGGIRAELAQLESARDRLRADITALERHLDQERIRLRASLSAALEAVDEHLAPAPPAPAAPAVRIPPKRVPKAGPLPEPEPAATEPAATESAPAEVPEVEAEPIFVRPEAESVPLAEPEPFEIEIVHTVADGAVTEPPAPRPSPAREAPVFDQAADDRFAPEPEPEAVPEPVAVEAVPDPAPEPEIPALVWAPEAAAAPVSAATPASEDDQADDLEEDPFIAELRRAITDTQPLGPREDEDMAGDAEGDLVHGDVLDGSRLGSLLRRRR